MPEHAGSFAMHPLVRNAGTGTRMRARPGSRKGFGTRLEPPADRPRGMRDFAMTDPSGVLWRIAQNLPD